MIDLEENKRKLVLIQEKMKSIGDSLWLEIYGTRNRKTRKANNKR